LISTPLLGEAVCLTAAFCWAVAVTLFRGPIAEHGAWVVNLAKTSIAAVLLGLTALAVGQGPALMAAPRIDLFWVAISGIFGLTLGDTALFVAVHRLGVHRTLLFQNLGPVFAALVAIGFYGERPGASDLLGAAVILLGVVLVVWPDRRAPRGPADPVGVVFAVLAALAQALGIVLAKDGMATVPALSASFVRLAAAALGLVIVLAFLGRLSAALRTLASPPALKKLLAPTFIGTYVAVFLMMLGIALAPASIAAVLLATPPVYSLFIDAKIQGTPITARSLGGTLLAVAGVGLLAWGG